MKHLLLSIFRLLFRVIVAFPFVLIGCIIRKIDAYTVTKQHNIQNDIIITEEDYENQ